MFANDTSIFISANDLYMMEKILNGEMKYGYMAEGD